MDPMLGFLPDLLKMAGSPAIVIFVLGLWRKWWYWGWYVAQLEQELVVWRQAALRGKNVTARSLEVAAAQKELLSR